MTTKVCQTPGSREPVITKLPSLQHFILQWPSRHSCNLVPSPPRGSNATKSNLTKPTSNRLSHSLKGNELIKSPIKKRMSFLKNKDAKKSATILHAVPETTVCGAALLSDQRDTTAHVSNKPQITLGDHASSAPSCNETSTSTFQGSNNAASTVSSSSTNLPKKHIGTYKHGKVQWQQKDQVGNHTKNGDGSDPKSRPKIHVVIPDANRERPLPAIPFFHYPSKNHIVTASRSDNVHDISPPSAGTKIIMRDSVVSPLNSAQPISFGQFQRSMSRVIRKTPIRPSKQRHNIKKASGSSVDSQESDSASTYSNRSSRTSVETDSPPLDTKHASRYSVQNPVGAGVFQSSPEAYVQFAPPSISPPRRYAHPPIEEDRAFIPSCSVKRPTALTRQQTIGRKTLKRPNIRRSLTPNNGIIDLALGRSTSRQLSNTVRVASPTLSEAENDLEERLASLEEEQKPAAISPQEELITTAMTEYSPFKWDEIMEPKNSNSPGGKPRKDSITIDMGTPPPPAVPRKSSKRQALARTNSKRVSRVPHEHIASQVKNKSGEKSPKLKVTIPDLDYESDDFVLSPIPIPPKHRKRSITPDRAEIVILNIFHSMDHFEDIFATAVVNRGFYRVFKNHELDLIKSTLKKMSPPAWEFREIAFPGHDLLHEEDLEMTRPQEEYTPTTYLQLQKRDIQTIRSIKTLIKGKCQSFLRPEISIALISDDPAATARIDDALWRIWNFCKIFGSGKGREEDITAQQDWLRGGLLVHQQTCTFSIMSTDYMNDTLVGAPECFAKGNEGGLTAEQLFDMMELWNCLGVLLQGFEGRTAQAREYGLYDNTEIRGGDIDGEEAMLDEWCYYLLTFGLSTVLELAVPCQHEDPVPFKIAAQHGWNEWNPPVFGGSRRNFLKEAASRVYEDKIARTYATTSTRDIQRQLSKQRIEKHIIELKHRKTSGPRLPMVHMSEERPMSEWSTVIGNLTRHRPVPSSESNIVSHIPSRRSALAQELTASIAELPAAECPNARASPPRRTVAMPLLPSPPPSTVPSVRDRNSIALSMPSIDEELPPAVPSLLDHPAFRHHNPATAPLRIQTQYNPQQHTRYPSDHSTHSHSSSEVSSHHPAFQQHATQRHIFGSAAHENTAEKAIYRIVEMGFTAEQAREALRMTDLGDGLRVDRAVELLLSRSM